MTRNQIEYRAHLENVRHNLAMEGETQRSNLAREAETYRSNVAHETETNRSNVARETETNRANVAIEQHNRKVLDLKEREHKLKKIEIGINTALKTIGLGTEMAT